MIPNNIIYDHILKAIQEIDSSKIPHQRESSNYDVFHDGKRYPPKYVISIANKYANGSELSFTEFNAIEAKTFLQKLGFEIKLKFDIRPGDILGNQQLSTLFGVGTQGGMRKSNKTNTLVIISDQTKPYYKDEWKGDIFHYTGMGPSGDQDIRYAQNKNLAESHTNGVEVHLFEVVTSGKYTYKGIVQLTGTPFEEVQKDKDGNDRKVVIFPLKLKPFFPELSDSMIIAGIGGSSNGWKGFEYQDITLNYIPREAWNFYDFDGQNYYGSIGDKTPIKFQNGGLILLCSTDPVSKKRVLIGYYGNVTFDDFTLPIDLADTIHDEQIRKQFKEKFSDPKSLEHRTSRNFRADKSLSTSFSIPIDFELNELGIKDWRRAPFMYIGDGAGIPKERARELLVKAQSIHQEVFQKALDEEREKMKSTIDKTQKVLDLYFNDSITNSNDAQYWGLLLINDGENQEYWKFFREKGLIGIGCSDSGYVSFIEKFGEKLLQFESREKYEEAFRGFFSDKRTPRFIWELIYQMKIGDVVIASTASTKDRSIIARGVIKSDARVDLNAHCRIVRDVEWNPVSPSIPVPDSLKGKFSNWYVKLTSDDYHQIMDQTPPVPPLNIFKKQVILYGPPGTGKTYSSVIKAHEIIFGNKDNTITYRLLQEKLRKKHESTIDLSQLTWIQAIVMAFDEINKEKVQVDEIKNSTIIRDFSTYKNNQYISNTIWGVLQAESAVDSTTVKFRVKSGREYFDKDTESNWYLTDKGKEFQQNLIKDLKEFPETSDSQFSFITFHQSFSYEDFVEGIRPELNNADESSIVYRVKDGIFKEICKKALKDPGNNYVLVIDEINRGNISKIFGELITLLEDNKRIGEREEIIVRLPYSNESFGVPGNVYIIGTMNSTDKSIALVDIALRRRFHFERLNVDYDLIQNPDAKTFLQELNSIICALKNADYEIGHYYFMNIPVEDPGNQALKQVFSNQILPLLEEYFFNDWEALATILGRDAITIETKKKFVWDDDSGKFEEETGDYDKIHGRCLKPLDAVFESAMNNLVIKKGTLEHNP